MLTTTWFLAACLTLTAAFYDIRMARIPNRLSYSGVVAGLLLCWLPGGVTPPLAGAGFLLAGGFFLLLWLFRAVGGGDVKLLAGVGALVGWPAILHVVFFMSLAGGVFGLLFLIWKPPGLKQAVGKRRIPYAPAIAVGVLLGWLVS